MKKILLIFCLLLIPFITQAQALPPQLQVSNLSIEKYSYQAGESIDGTFTVFNIGDQDANEISYKIAYGTYGEGGGELQNEFDVVNSSQTLFIPSGENKKVSFSIIPTTEVVERQGIHVVLMHKSGVVLAWKKIPIQVEGGQNLKQVDMINGVIIIDQYEYPLTSGATVSEDSVAELGVALINNEFTGSRKGKIIIKDRSAVGATIYEGTVDVEFEDGVGYVDLPFTGLNPESYSAQFSLIDSAGLDSSNILNFRFVVAGAQAEIINIQTSSSKLKKDENFNLQVSYSGTPANINFDTELISERVEQINLRFKVVNENNETIATYDGIVEGQSDETVGLEEGSEEYVDSQLNNTFLADIDLRSSNSSKQIFIEAELYNPVTGEVYDTYQTTFDNGGFDYQLIAYLVAGLVLIALIFVLMLTKHKVPTVCFVFIITSLFSAYMIVQNTEARTAYSAGGGNGGLVIGSPISSQVGGYDPGEEISLDLTYTVWACANNGNLNLKVFIPKNNTWHSFANGAQAVGHISLNLPTRQLTWNCTTVPYRGSLTRQVCFPAYQTNESAHYKEVIRVTNTWQDSGAYWGNTYLNIDDALTAPSTPGYHYIPFAYQYCTGSHGCAGVKYTAWEICVNGSGVCPGEDEVDYCPNIDLAGDDIGVPDGYKLDAEGNCVPDNINVCQPEPDPSNLGQVCGCNNAGTIQCDGGCRTGEGVDIPVLCNDTFSVSCSASPTNVEPNQNTSVSATVENATGTVSYLWTLPSGSTSNSTSLSYSNSSIGSYQFTVDVEDAEGNTATNNCRVTVSEPGCDDSHDGETVCVAGQEYVWVCTGSEWDRVPTGNACSDGDPVVDFWEFDPWIITTGDTCKVDIRAQDVASCSVYDKDGVARYTVTSGSLNTIDVDSQGSFDIGTYELRCTGVGEGASEVAFGTDKCVSNLEVREN